MGIHRRCFRWREAVGVRLHDDRLKNFPAVTVSVLIRSKKQPTPHTLWKFSCHMPLCIFHLFVNDGSIWRRIFIIKREFVDCLML